MTAEAVDLAADDEVDDLTDIALAHPVVHKRLDLSRINVGETLSLGDISDMARELGTDPGRLASVLANVDKPEDRANLRGITLDVVVALAWIIARKGDPDLDIDTVRRTWQIELVGVGTTKPNPRPARARKTPPSSGPRGSSRTRG